MNVTIRWLLPLTSSLVFLLGCQGNRQALPLTAPTTTQKELEGGTDSTGGGNGLAGRPLDAYIEKNLFNQPYFVNHVKPLVQKLGTSYPPLAADFYHIALQRDWYFLPATLDQISKQILGTYAKTDQMALQDLNKIWIDSNLFNRMSERDQGTLIIHEIIMGVRLMNYKSDQDNCIAEAAFLLVNGQDSKRYSEARRKCRLKFPAGDSFRSQRFKLTSDDYDLIRRIVSLLDREHPDIEEVQSLIESTGFRKYEN